jgi:archaellum component FlaC
MYNEVAELKAENKRLNKQLSMVAKFYDDFYKNEISTLAAYKNNIRDKYCKLRNKIKDKNVIPKNRIKAKVMLWSRVFGKSKLTNKEIADQCFSTLSVINRLSIEVYNEKLQVNR